MVTKIKNFILDAKAELMKVNWPSKNQTINYTLMVIGVSVAVSLFLGGMDYIFGQILKTYIIK